MPERKHKLLVVDDEYLNRDMLKQRLTRSGFEVREAENAQQALEVIENNEVDLVLLDTMMPGMSGIDLLKLLRGVHGHSDLPVIMATAVTDSRSIANALQLGANDYVSKPIDFPVALARIHSQLERREAVKRLRESEERYALASRGNGDGIWDWDLLVNRVYYSARWKSMAGLDGMEISESPDVWLSRVHEADIGMLLSRLKVHWSHTPAGNHSFFCEFRMRHSDGNYYWRRSRGHTVYNGAGEAVRMTGSLVDITEHKVYDSLTGLANRLLFLERASLSIERAARNRQYRFAVLFLDIDRFKLINDTLGHIAGDQLLVHVAERLKAICGSQEGINLDDLTIARFGGDEFAILVEDLSKPSDAEAVARRLLHALVTPFELAGREVYCNVSIGISVWNSSYQSVEELLRDADTAMYGAKAQGGSGYAVFDEVMRMRTAMRLEMETGLYKAVERNELTLYYQPKVKLDTGILVGFEALLRWNHPKLGLVCPSDFIPVAESTGQIVSIGKWVIGEACRQMVEWQKAYPKCPPLAISVNLSVRQFRQPDIIEVVEEVLRETGLPPACLQLEITESIVMDNPEAAVHTTQRLKALGVGIKLDDFGTGYSGLSYLCRMPIDTLKIDKSFILRMREHSTDLEIVRTVITLARSLGMNVVAEGIERDDQLAQLRSLGCEFGQGYYFGRPIASAETARLLAATDEDGLPPHTADSLLPLP